VAHVRCRLPSLVGSGAQVVAHSLRSRRHVLPGLGRVVRGLVQVLARLLALLLRCQRAGVRGRQDGLLHTLERAFRLALTARVRPSSC
jgi:hypothetical protein